MKQFVIGIAMVGQDMISYNVYILIVKKKHAKRGDQWTALEQELLTV